MEETAQQRVRWHGKPATVGSVLKYIALIGAAWSVLVGTLTPVLGPGALKILGDAMAGNIKEQVQKQTQPNREGVRALLQDKIDELSAKVAVLEARRDRDRQRWTDADAIELSSATSRLEKQKAALKALDQAAWQ